MSHLPWALALVLVPVVAVMALPWALKSVSVMQRAVIGKLPLQVLAPASLGEFGRFRESNVAERTSFSPRFVDGVTAEAHSRGMAGIICHHPHSPRRGGGQ